VSCCETTQMLLPSSKNCQFRNNSSLNNVKIALYAIAVPVRNVTNVNKSGVRTLLATGGHVTFLPYRRLMALWKQRRANGNARKCLWKYLRACMKFFVNRWQLCIRGCVISTARDCASYFGDKINPLSNPTIIKTNNCWNWNWLWQLSLIVP